MDDVLVSLAGGGGIEDFLPHNLTAPDIPSALHRYP